MNSDVMNNGYANNNDILYGAHYIELISDEVTYENPKGKFTLQYVTPNMKTSEEYSKTLPKNSTYNVINKDNLGTTRITNTNYIELVVPSYFFNITDLKIETHTVRKGPGVTQIASSTGVSGGDSHSHSISSKYNQWTLLFSCNPEVIISRKKYTKGQKFIAIGIGGSINSLVIIGVV